MMVGAALEIKLTLNKQECGKEWEYRVIAVNKAGERDPSNTVTAVLCWVGFMEPGFASLFFCYLFIYRRE
uniref:hypothetical protein n=1 Tax=Candidatus Electrothrix sp. TaxID=2170559 RepID=UPI004055C585